MRTWQQVTMRSKLWLPACYSVPKSEPIWSVFSIYNVFSEHKVRLLRVFFSIHSVFSRQLRLPACYCAPKVSLMLCRPCDVPALVCGVGVRALVLVGVRALVLVGASLLNMLNTFNIENTRYVENKLCRTHRQYACLIHTRDL